MTRDDLQEEQPRIVASSGALYAKLISQNDQVGVAAYQRLRFDYFIAKRGWVKPLANKPGFETDGYDETCWHLGVFDSQDYLLAYLRMLPWYQDTGFMLELEFRCLLSNEDLQRLHREYSIEISRLVVADGLGRRATLRAVELLFKAFYQFCVSEGIQHMYAVVEEEWLSWCERHFGFSFHCIGTPAELPYSNKTIVIYACLDELGKSVGVPPEKLAWYKDAD